MGAELSSIIGIAGWPPYLHEIPQSGIIRVHSFIRGLKTPELLRTERGRDQRSCLKTVWSQGFLVLCSTLASQFDKFEPTFAQLTDAFPEFEDFQMAIVGVSLPREKPCSGFAHLKKGDETVATIDLSQTGKASWMFKDYDAKAHRIIWDAKKCDPEPKMFMEMEWGREAVEAKEAILVRKTK